MAKASTGSRDVLQVLRSQTAVTQRQLVLHLIVGLPGNADTAALGDSFETGRDVDAVSVEIIALDDHVAEMHADAKCHLAVAARAAVARRHGPLDFGRAVDALDDAGEFRQQAVAHQLHCPAAMLGDRRVDHLRAMLVQQGGRARLVLAHQPAVADRVGGQDRGQSAFHQSLTAVFRRQRAPPPRPRAI